MKKAPTDIIASLVPSERAILEKMLQLEKGIIHIQDIQKNVAKERQAVEGTRRIIDEAIKDED
tara:strand:+ start:3833 stop:4021 length:189 start_codon:yes stop_codon:yes gene_type:complete